MAALPPSQVVCGSKLLCAAVQHLLTRGGIQRLTNLLTLCHVGNVVRKMSDFDSMKSADTPPPQLQPPAQPQPSLLAPQPPHQRGLAAQTVLWCPQSFFCARTNELPEVPITGSSPPLTAPVSFGGVGGSLGVDLAVCLHLGRYHAAAHARLRAVTIQQRWIVRGRS